MADPHEMTDDQLVARCRNDPWRTRVQNLGCMVGLLVPLALCAGAVYIQRENWVEALLMLLWLPIFMLFSGIFIVLPMMEFADREVRPFEEELARRYDPSEPAWSPERVRHDLTTPGGPNWILLLVGSGLPHGGVERIRAAVWDAPNPRGEIRSHYHPFLNDLLRDERDHPTFAEFRARVSDAHAELPADACERLLGLCRQPNPPLVPPCYSVHDGFPCHVTVAHRGDERVLDAECNLAGAHEPRESIAVALLDVSSTMGESAGVWGACDPYGNITLGAMGARPLGD